MSLNCTEMLGSGNSTRRLVGHEGSHPKVLCRHCLTVQKVQIFQQQVEFECPHQLWLSALLKLYSFYSKTIICRFPAPPKILGENAKSNHSAKKNHSPPKKSSIKLKINQQLKSWPDIFIFKCAVWWFANKWRKFGRFQESSLLVRFPWRLDSCSAISSWSM